MKKIIINIKIVGLALSLLIGFNACEKDFEELNQNPFLPTEALIGPLFNELISSLRLGHVRQLYLHNEHLYPATELAALTARTFQNASIGAEAVWQNYYTALSTSRAIEERFAEYTGDPEALTNVQAQLKIVMAYMTFQMTDLFGDMPYTEAGRAFENSESLRPKFDSQEEIYKSLLDDLAWATANIVNEGNPRTESGEAFVSFGLFDTFYQNNWTSWIKFANSLQLRHLLRMVEKDPDFVNPRVKTMIEEGASFLADGEDVVMNPREQAWDNWGLNWSFREHNKIRMGSNLWNYMKDPVSDTIVDPRAYIFFETNNEDEWVPFPQVADNNIPQSGGEPYLQDKRDRSYWEKGEGNIYSNFNYYLIRDNRDIPEFIMTAAEVKFLLAEVFARGIGVNQDFANADFNYILGMFASQTFWQNIMLDSPIWENNVNELTTGQLFSVSDHPKYNIMMTTDMDEKLDLIYAQRWIDHFRQPWEAFALVRRTGRTPREGPANTLYRFQYPPSEVNNNPEEWAAQDARMGGDKVDVKMWWMN